MPFTYHRSIRFQETDAAGVVYFANVLTLCHEAYEASLEAIGIDLKSFFSNPEIAIPITHASVDFFRPLFCGDRPLVRLTPQQTSEYRFEIQYELLGKEADQQTESILFSRATTQHVCIHPTQRQKILMPTKMLDWLGRWGNG